MIDPTIGIIYARDKHPAAKRLADLTDEDVAALVLCDEHLPLSEALEKEWGNDAHLIMYRVDADPTGSEYAFLRVSKRSAFVEQLEQAEGQIRVVALVFDHDLPKLVREDGTSYKQEWSADSLEEFVQVLQEAVGTSIPEPTAWYTTLHGSRFVYVLTEEVSHLDCEAMMRGMREQFAKAGIELDDARCDWTGLYRMPRTVREDTDVAYEPAHLLTGGPLLDPSTVQRIEGVANSFADVDPYQGEMPDPDETRALLEYKGENGRMYDSALVKTARTYLQGREAFGVVFEHKPIIAGESGWNNGVTRIVGQVVGMLARQDGASPEGCYALLHSAIEQLQDRENRGANATDWYTTAWSLVSRMWASEEAQIIAERQEAERAAAKGKEHRGTLLDKLRAARPDDVPEDPGEAHEWFQHCMIASDGRRHHIMNAEGDYNIRSVSDSMLIPMIRDLGMENTIPTTELRGKNVVQRSATSLLNDHATPITAIVCSATDEVAYIDGPAGHKVLHIPVHRLNLKLEARFDQRVDQWLQALGGDKYDQLTEWLAHALDVQRAICALNLYGSPGTGKGMLAAGLAECFEGETRNDGRALGKFNVGLLDSPIVNCDEGVPKISSDEALTVDQAFRSMVTGGKLTVRAMHRDPFTADIYPRILFTSNDRDIIRAIVGHRDLTADDIRAIELRLLSIEVGDDAHSLLTRNGNFSYTKGWVAPRSDYRLANHIMWLYEHRVQSQHGDNRLLVEGETSTDLVREMRLRSKGAQIVLRSLVKMIESPGTVRRGMHIHGNRVWATPACIVEYSETMLVGYNDLTLPVAGRVLRQFTTEDTKGKATMSNPPGTQREQRARWVEIDLGIVYEEGMRYGLTLDRTHKLLSEQPGGDAKIAAVDAITD